MTGLVNRYDNLEPSSRPDSKISNRASAHTCASVDDAGDVEWEKVLWRKQPFADNHVPRTFLAELNDIPPRPRPRFRSLVIASLPVTQHVSTIALFLGVFHALLDGSLDPTVVGWSCVICGLGGWGIHNYGWGSMRGSDNPFIPPPTPLRQLILPPLLLSLLSPILASLTSATTSDSIWPLAGGLFFVHLLLADFSTGEDKRRKRRLRRLKEERIRRGSVGEVDRTFVLEEKSLSSSLSLTSALSASIVLASRLPSTSHVFSLILLSVLLFAGWPRITKGVRESGGIFSISLTSSMILLAVSFFPTIHSAQGHLSLEYEDAKGTSQWVGWEGWGMDGWRIVFGIIVLLINLVGPGLLCWAWRWKVRRGGRWDAAKVTLKRRMSIGRPGTI